MGGIYTVRICKRYRKLCYHTSSKDPPPQWTRGGISTAGADIDIARERSAGSYVVHHQVRKYFYRAVQWGISEEALLLCDGMYLQFHPGAIKSDFASRWRPKSPRRIDQMLAVRTPPCVRCMFYWSLGVTLAARAKRGSVCVVHSVHSHFDFRAIVLYARTAREGTGIAHARKNSGTLGVRFYSKLGSSHACPQEKNKRGVGDTAALCIAHGPRAPSLLFATARVGAPGQPTEPRGGFFFASVFAFHENRARKQARRGARAG